jgi:adenylylsulfate kinase-like enzyme
VARTLLSKGLGFSKEDRDTNIRRIGYIASEIVRHGGAAVCAAISPHRATRDEGRRSVGPERFVEVFMATPLEVCGARPEGTLRRAARGEITGVTGVDDSTSRRSRPRSRSARPTTSRWRWRASFFRRCNSAGLSARMTILSLVRSVTSSLHRIEVTLGAYP